MRTCHRCASCGFEATVGWIHYDEPIDGFGAETLLLCTRCGTPHRVGIVRSWKSTGPRYNVTLIDVGAHRARVLAAIRAMIGCDVQTAMVRAAVTPTTLLEDVGLDAANDARVRLESAGGRVDVRAHGDELYLRASPPSGGEPDWQLRPIEGDRRGELGEIDIEAQPCGACGVRGSLVSELPSETHTCPRCGVNGFEKWGGYIT